MDHIDDLKFCRYILNVNSSTNKTILYGELGRYPLHVNYMYRCIKYWLKILYMEPTRYPKACYDMLLQLDLAGRVTWPTYIKRLLGNLGFNDVWIYQGVTDVNLFLQNLKCRLKDVFLQSWYDELLIRDRLCTYRLFKVTFGLEIPSSRDNRLCKAVTRFRCGNHHLAVETGRWCGIDRDQRICNYCCKEFDHRVIEDEIHFICTCPLYSDLRITLFDKTHITNYHAVTLNFCKLMEDTSCHRYTGIYICNAFDRRDKYQQEHT